MQVGSGGTVRPWKVLDFVLRLFNIAVLAPKITLNYQSQQFMLLADHTTKRKRKQTNKKISITEVNLY